MLLCISLFEILLELPKINCLKNLKFFTQRIGTLSLGPPSTTGPYRANPKSLNLRVPKPLESCEYKQLRAAISLNIYQ